MMTGGDNQDKEKKRLSSSRQLANTAISLGFSVIIFVVIGVFLDSLFKTAPIFILIGVFFALASMAYFMWQLIKAP
ncbi:MAG TPA: AtpZ/AtpI family protein [Chloroflexia bacterium]|nr:AtpZ/AtpI family protein [Chloroflexia bacterium]